MTVIQSYNSKNTPSGKLYAVKIAESVVPDEFPTFPTSLFEPKNEREYSLLFICLCLDFWLCLKMGSENIVLVRLLQRGAKDLTVSARWTYLPVNHNLLRPSYQYRWSM